jgi:hypothetical protein
MDQSLKLNCNNSDKKGVDNWRMCDELAQCLKDPLAYKLKKEEQKWEDMLEDFYIAMRYSRNNAWWVCLIFLITAITKYIRMK